MHEHDGGGIVELQHPAPRARHLRGRHNTGVFERVSQAAADWSGRTETLVAAVLICLVWGITGPYFHYSDTWQLVINTFTNLVTFVMVFLIQRSQNKDTMAVQLKLNEIVAAVHGASNQMIAVEDLSEQDLRRLHDRYVRLLNMTEERRAAAGASSSIDALRGEPTGRRSP